jgi:hypothetical protein
MKRRTFCLVVVYLLAASSASRAVGTYNIYYGHLHNHCNLSDGSGTPAQAYSAAKAAGLDFFGLADHSYSLTATEYQTMKDAANTYADSTFTTFWGFEWSGGAYGHVAVINASEYCSTDTQPTFDALLSWLSSNNCVAFLNHPGRHTEATSEFDHFTDWPSDAIVGMELWNREEPFDTFYYNGGYTSDSRDRSGYYDEALFNGWHIGAAGSRDTHDSTWGSGEYRLAILAGANARADLYSALGARRFYSTLDRNLELSFRVNGEEMGSSIAGGLSQCVVEAADRDGEGFSQVEVIHNGYVVYTQDVAGQMHPVVTCDLYTQQGDYIYCKVTQSDGGEAISSPVFITSDGPDGPPRADLTAPLDNGSDDLNPVNGQVTVNTTQSAFQIQLSDFEGVDDSTVADTDVSITELTLNVGYAFAYSADTHIITLTPLPAGSVFGNGTYTITVSGISDVAVPPNTMALTTLTVLIDTSIVAPEMVHFQQGLNGYAGTVDTMVRAAAPTSSSYAASAIITTDLDDMTDTGYQPSHVLLRFDDIIGGTAGQIPAGATINSATLRLRSLDTGGGGSLHAMLQPWSGASTWDSLVGGIQADDVEAASDADDSIASNSLSDVDLDVTATLQNWADGTMANNGWAVLPNTTDGWDIASAEHATADYRPELIVTFLPGSPIYTAHNPSPANPASGVPVSTVLTWAKGTGAVTHRLYLATSQAGLGLPENLVYDDIYTSYDPTPDLAFGTTYWWRVDERDSLGNIVTGADWTFSTVPAAVFSKAVSESTTKGVVGGSYVDTQSRDDGAYETITEVLSAPNKNAYSTLEHVWRFDVVPGTYIEFTVEANRSASTDGDNFDFSYSTDGTTYHYMLTVASATDTVQSFVLPSNTAGAVYVKAIDTNHIKGYTRADILSVDFMQIVSSQVPIPRPPVANAGQDWTVTDVDGNGSETVTLTGSGSDPDGSAVQFQWYDDGVAIAGAIDAVLTYDFPVGTYTATLVVTDADSMTDSDDAIVIVRAAGASMHVADLDGVASVKGNSGQWAATVTVTVVDQAGTPVSGATVTGTWSGAVGGTGTGVTGSDGKVVLTSPNVRGGASVTFTMTDVTHSSYTYDPAANVETSTTVNKP